MSEYKLVRPNKDFIKEIQNFKDEINNTPSDFKFEGCAGLQEYDDIIEWIEKTEKYFNPDTCPKDKVPSTLFLYVDDNNKIIGMIDVRHHINHPYLSLFGGHIGYSIRPSERRKGYGSKMLQEALKECKKMNIDKVLVTCDKGNTGSEMVIRNNGGVFEKEVEHEGKAYKRFWITL